MTTTESITPSELLDSDSLVIIKDAIGRLSATDKSGVIYEGIDPLRLFPLSDPMHWIALLAPDGREVACIADPEKLDTATFQLLNEELASREFIPLIHRVLAVSGNSEPCEWQVETDRGATTFVLNHENDVRRLKDHRILIIDAHGIRYLILDDRKLDLNSRRIIEWYA